MLLFPCEVAEDVTTPLLLLYMGSEASPEGMEEDWDRLLGAV